GSVLATGDENGMIESYSLPGMIPAPPMPPPTRALPLSCLALTRDRVVRHVNGVRTNGWLLAAAYKGGEIVIWDLYTRHPRVFCRGSSWSVTSLAFDREGVTLASAGRSEARLWDVMSGRQLLVLGN